MKSINLVYALTDTNLLIFSVSFRQVMLGMIYARQSASKLVKDCLTKPSGTRLKDRRYFPDSNETSLCKGNLVYLHQRIEVND
jgi:hypothetical protein